MKYLFFDAETDGLYGQFLSIGALVCDEAGNELNSFYHSQSISIDEIQCSWVKENVYPILDGGILHDSEAELIESFWSFYKDIKPDYCIADVMYPVEARLFNRCVLKDLDKRQFDAPFPLLDLSSMLYAAGINPNAERRTLVDCSNLQQHNALDDVRMSIRIWKKFVKR